MSDDKFTVVQDGTVLRLRQARDRLKQFHDECDERGHTDTGEAWDVMTQAFDAIDEIFTPRKKFSVHIRLADEIIAKDYGEAFDKMMEAFEDRSGFEIMGHDIIEEPFDDNS